MTTIQRALRSSMRRLLLRPNTVPDPGLSPALPESMRRQTDAVDVMTQARESLDRIEDQVIYGGVVFLNAEQIGTLPLPDQAAVHSGPLPPMDFFRWPVSGMARVVARMVRKLAAPFTRRQERFNLDLLEAMRRMEDRLETQNHLMRQLRHRIAELEERLGSWE
jgi:hypothetical protein